MKALRPPQPNTISTPLPVRVKRGSAPFIGSKSLKYMVRSAPLCRPHQNQSNLTTQTELEAIVQPQITISTANLSFQNVSQVTPDPTVLVLLAAGSISSDPFLGYSVNGRATYHMRLVLWLPLLAGLVTPSLHAGAVQFDVTSLGANSYQYSYLLTGITFQPNQDLDLLFDPALYSGLTNGTASGDFNVFLFQPDNPPGATGDFISFTTTGSTFTGPFTVDFTFLGVGQPGSQPWQVNQFDDLGNLVSNVDSGTTVASTTAPEPTSMLLGGVGLLLLAGAAFARRRSMA